MIVSSITWFLLYIRRIGIIMYTPGWHIGGISL